MKTGFSLFLWKRYKPAFSLIATVFQGFLTLYFAQRSGNTFLGEVYSQEDSGKRESSCVVVTHRRDHQCLSWEATGRHLLKGVNRQEKRRLCHSHSGVRAVDPGEPLGGQNLYYLG